MVFHRKFVTTFNFSNKGSFGGFKQFMYGNTFTVLDAFWVSLCNLFFFFFLSFRVNSDKETSLVLVQKQNTIESSVYEDQNQAGVESLSFHGSSLVSTSKIYNFFSDKTNTGFVEEPKAVCFIFHGYSAPVEEKKMLTFSDDDDDSNTSSMVVLEKPFTVENKMVKSSQSEVFLIKEHVKEEMLVYEFMSCGVFKELLAHENFVCGEEENLFDDDDGFIELNPSLQISNLPYEEEEEEEFMKREEPEVYDDDDDDDDDEFEHSDVIERLKTEIKTARTGGLCTILEDSETPLEELKPLKIESKPDQFKDRIAEIHKVYKNYAVKMRKLDVIDSQTMHSISK